MSAGGAEGEGSHSHHSQGLWIVGGLLVILSMGLPWFTYHVVNPSPHESSLTGIQLFTQVPEIGIVAALGFAMVIFGSVAWRDANRQAIHTTIHRVGHTLCSIALLAIPVEAVWRFSATSSTLYGTAMWNSLGIGWEVAVAGAAVALLGSLADWVLPPTFLSKANPAAM